MNDNVTRIDTTCNDSSSIDSQKSQPLIVGATKDTIVTSFLDDIQSLWLPAAASSNDNTNCIPIYNYGAPSSINFLRDHVAISRPCIIRNMNMCRNNHDDKINDNSNRTAFNNTITLDSLVALDPDLLITVDVTPDGYGDCIRKVAICTGSDCKDNDGVVIDESITTTVNGNSMAETIANTSSCTGSHRQRQETIVHDCFVQPEQRMMTIGEFQNKLRYQSTKRHWYHDNIDDVMNRTFDQLQSTTTMETDDQLSCFDDEEEDIVVYYSRQNDCLRSAELQPIWNHIQCPTTFDFVQNVFCEPNNNDTHDSNNDSVVEPTAINLWIGNGCSVSSLHKDYYENLYYVCSGTKIITLCPPCDILFLNEQEYEFSGTFRQQVNRDTKKKEWFVQLDNDNPQQKYTGSRNKVRWIGGGDVTRKSEAEHVQQYSYIQYTNPITITVHANEMIYIPSLWLHHVTQSYDETTVAINYWYEMNFQSPLYIYFHLLQQMKYLPTSTTKTATTETASPVTDCLLKHN